MVNPAQGECDVIQLKQIQECTVPPTSKWLISVLATQWALQGILFNSAMATRKLPSFRQPFPTACTLEPCFTRTLSRRHRLFLLARVLIVLHPTWFYVSVRHFGTRQERIACTEMWSWKQPDPAAHACVPSTLEVEQGWSKVQSGEFKVSLDYRRPCLKDRQTKESWKLCCQIFWAPSTISGLTFVLWQWVLVSLVFFISTIASLHTFL